MIDTPVGTLVPLARTAVCSVSAFDHLPGRDHVDPAAEILPEATLILTRAGRWDLATAGSTGQVTAGHLVALDAGQEYRVSHDEARPTDRTLSISLAGPLVASLRAAAAAPGRLFASSHHLLTADANGIVDALVGELRAERPARGLAIDGLVTTLAAYAVRGRDVRAGSGHAGRLAQVRDHVREHYAEDLSLAGLASVANLSPWYLSRQFKEQYGIGLRRYLVQVRLGHAADLLAAGAPVGAAAAKAGFGSVSHFRAAFRDEYGVGPSEWRARRGR